MRKIGFLVLMLLLAFQTNVQARKLKNTWASWYTVTQSQTTIVLPYSSVDVTIRNGDASQDIFIDLFGGIINNDFVSSGSARPSIIQLDSNSQIKLDDFYTDSISIVTDSPAGASPVTVIITY